MYLLSWRICYDGIFNTCCFTNPIINFVQWSWMRVLLMVAWLFMEVLLIMLCYWGCGCILAPPISALFSRNSHFIILMLLLVARIALAIRSFCFGFQGSPAVSLFGVTEQYHACSNFKFWLWLISMCVAVWLHPIFLYNNNNIIAYYTVYFISNKDSKWSSLKYCYSTMYVLIIPSARCFNNTIVCPAVLDASIINGGLIVHKSAIAKKRCQYLW